MAAQSQQAKVRAPKRQVIGLMDEAPVIIYPTLAQGLGANHAAAFQKLHFLLNSVEEDEIEYNFMDGYWWVYNTYPDWKRKYLKWLSESAIKNVFHDLEMMGLVKSMMANKYRGDRTKWYRIDYDVWNNIQPTMRQNLSDGSWDKKYLIMGQILSPLEWTKFVSSNKKSTKESRKDSFPHIATARSDSPDPKSTPITESPDTATVNQITKTDPISPIVQVDVLEEKKESSAKERKDATALRLVGSFNPAMLKLSLDLRGHEASWLTDQTGVGGILLAKYLSGEFKPPAEIIQIFGELLGFPAEFFYQEGEIKPPDFACSVDESGAHDTKPIPPTAPAVRRSAGSPPDGTFNVGDKVDWDYVSSKGWGNYNTTAAVVIGKSEKTYKIMVHETTHNQFIEKSVKPDKLHPRTGEVQPLDTEAAKRIAARSGSKGKAKKPSVYGNDEIFNTIGKVLFYAADQAEINAVGGRIGPIREALLDHIFEKRKAQGITETDFDESTIKQLICLLEGFGPDWDENNVDDETGKSLTRPQHWNSLSAAWIRFCKTDKAKQLCGTESKPMLVKCEACAGRGYIGYRDSDGRPQHHNCEKCNGKGKVAA